MLVSPLNAQNFEVEDLFRGSTNRPPAMRSVFWNTVLGSLWGAVVGSTLILDDDPLFRKAVIGASVGGIIGYGVGLILVVQGITFDPLFLPGVRIVENQSAIGSQPTHFAELEWTVFHETF